MLFNRNLIKKSNKNIVDFAIGISTYDKMCSKGLN